MMNKYIVSIILVTLFIIVIVFGKDYHNLNTIVSPVGVFIDEIISNDVVLNDAQNVFSDSFEIEVDIHEAGKSHESESSNWWLSSGGIMEVKNGVAKTIHDNLNNENKWRGLYYKNNPRDTDNGFHPQNIFRLVTKGEWKNLTQQVIFSISTDNLSESSYRNDSNGILFFNRYKDSNNLYYAGIRVDGFAVIKKKIEGTYFTLAYNQIYPGKYDREKNPNLLPHGQWIGLKSEVTDNGDDSVNIKLYIDRERNGNWELIAEAVDEGRKYGGYPFFDTGHGGIRTDFMDVEFDDYSIREVNVAE